VVFVGGSHAIYSGIESDLDHNNVVCS